MMMKKTLRLTSLTALSLCMVACQGFDDNRATQFQSLTQDQQNQYWQQKNIAYLMDRLQQAGAMVYHYGDEYQIIIPPNKLFMRNSDLISSNASYLIESLINFINAQATPEVRILAYTNKTSSKEENFAITQGWGESLANKLRESGLIAGVVSAQGHGECDNIGKDNAFTNRIEIRFRITHEH